MIVDIALSPHSIDELSAHRLARAAIAAQTNVFETMRSHGALVFAGPDELLAFRGALDSSLLSETEKKRWRELILHLMSQGRVRVSSDVHPMKLDEIHTEDELSDFAAAGGESILVLQSTQFDALFPNNEAGLVDIPGSVSAAVVPALAHTLPMARQRTLALSGCHPFGTPRDDVWNEIFDPLAKRSKHIVVTDAYLFKEVARRAAGRRGYGASVEHLSWLLTKIASRGRPGTRVTLVATHSIPDGQSSVVPGDAAQVADMLQTQWTSLPGAIVELSIVLAPFRGSQLSFPHNRHIRFDMLGFNLSEGLDRLRDTNVRDPDGFNWEYKFDTQSIDALKAREQRVRNERSVKIETRML